MRSKGSADESICGTWRSTTILSVRSGDEVAVGGDGQVTLN